MLRAISIRKFPKCGVLTNRFTIESSLGLTTKPILTTRLNKNPKSNGIRLLCYYTGKYAVGNRSTLTVFSQVQPMRLAHTTANPQSEEHVSTESQDMEMAYLKTIESLRSTYFAKNTTRTSKALKLRDQVAQLLYILASVPQLKVQSNDIRILNDIAVYIDTSGLDASEQLKDELKIQFMTSLQRAMTKDHVGQLTFFAKYYTDLRSSSRYVESQNLRLQLYSVFVDYILVESGEDVMDKLEQFEILFIKEEKELQTQMNTNELNPKEFVIRAVSIVTNALQNKDLKPSVSLSYENLKTCLQLKNLDTQLAHSQMEILLSQFFEASAQCVSDSPVDHNVCEMMHSLIKVIDTGTDKYQNKVQIMKWLINLLYFSQENNFREVSQKVLKKIANLSAEFSDESLLKELKNDEVPALILALLRFENNQDHASKVMKMLEDGESNVYLQLADLQLDLYYLVKSSQTTPQMVIDLVTKFNEKREPKIKDSNEIEFEEEPTQENDVLEITDTKIYNTMIECCCLADKSAQFIESTTILFHNNYSLTRDAKSFSILINHFLDKEDYIECLDLFDRSIEESVLWSDEENAIYVPVLFKTLNFYLNQPIASQDPESINSLQSRILYTQKLNELGYRLDPSSLCTLVGILLDKGRVMDAVDYFQSEVEPLEDPKDEDDIVPRHDANGKYKNAFDKFLKYAITKYGKSEMKTCREVYNFLNHYFFIPYDAHLYFIQCFLDNDNPRFALDMFHEIREKTVTQGLNPPNEKLYSYLFRRFGREGYEHGVVSLHLYMRMDQNIDLTIELLNSVMEAYCHIGDVLKVRDVFNIACGMPIPIGVNEESCYFMLKSLKHASLDHASDFFYDMTRFGIPHTHSLYHEFIICHCYHEQYMSAANLLHEAREKGIEIDREMLKVAYNFALRPGVKIRVENTGMRVNREAWLELKASGELLHDNEVYPSLIESPQRLVKPLDLIPPMDSADMLGYGTSEAMLSQ